jgi:cbb3-type cytochrome oxidase subunit 3
MSTLIYSVREDETGQSDWSGNDRRQVNLVIGFVVLAIGPGVFLVDRLIGTVAWRAFFAEALSLCLYAALAVWYALRRQPRTARQVAIVVYVIGLFIMGLVDILTKRGLGESLVDSARAKDPILLAGVLMLLFLPLIGWVVWRYPVEMGRIGLGRGYSRSRLALFVLVGLGVGLLVSAHFWLTARIAGIDFEAKPWPYLAWQFFYEVGPQSLTEELFLRGVVFNELYFVRTWNFWAAALAASSLELLSLLVKQNYSVSALVVAGAVFYTLVSSLVSAGLFRWSHSAIPGYANNVVFGVLTAFR